MEQLQTYLTEIVSFVLGTFAGSLLTLYVKNQRASGRSSVVDQSRSQAGGDIVGRDKISK